MEIEEHIVVKIINSRVEGAMCCPTKGHHIERGCENIHPLVALDLTHHGDIVIVAQAASKREKCAALPSTRVSLSNNHRGHRQVTMTTTSDDNDHADQEDIKMEEDDLTPHQSHLGTETTENHNEFHKNKRV